MKMLQDVHKLEMCGNIFFHPIPSLSNGRILILISFP